MFSSRHQNVDLLFQVNTIAIKLKPPREMDVDLEAEKASSCFVAPLGTFEVLQERNEHIVQRLPKECLFQSSIFL